MKSLACKLASEIRALQVQDTRNIRAVRRKYSERLKDEAAEQVLVLSREVFQEPALRWVAYELLRFHRKAFESLGKRDLLEFGAGLCSWGDVDAFAGLLSGPAWGNGQISDAVIHQWARSPNRWWRRAALVSTVALNKRSWGGRGDVRRTLSVCRILVHDSDNMVVKAMSWALRELVPHDLGAVRQFLEDHRVALASRIKREVNNKLTTGLKNPRRRPQ